MTKCGYADEYQAIRKPTCGCETCHAKWEAQLDEDYELLAAGIFK